MTAVSFAVSRRGSVTEAGNLIAALASAGKAGVIQIANTMKIETKDDHNIDHNI